MFYSGPLDTQFEPLTGFEDFEIKLDNGLAVIRRIKDGFQPKYSHHKSSGYIHITLNGKKCQLHRVIANHYINHDDKHNIVTFIDKNGLNYHIMNLRFVTNSDLNKTRSSSCRIEYDFVDELPDNAVGVVMYNDHFFRNYFYANQEFFYWTGIKYRKLHKIENSKSYSVRVVDNDDNWTTINIDKWIKLNGF